MSWNKIRVTIGCIVTVSAAHAQEPGDPRVGLSFAQRTCAGCHGVLATDRVSPMPGLATFNVIADAPGMTGTALSVWLRTSHRSMPNLMIEPDDRNNVIAYIISLRSEPMPR